MAKQDPARTFTEMAEATAQLHFGIFDKRVLLPLSRLPECVLGETKEVLLGERLDRLVEEGWIPRLMSEDGVELGFPLYVPSRVGLLLQLESQRYSPAELRAIASYEEEYIDNILVAEDSPYLDDDRETLLNEWRHELAVSEGRLKYVLERKKQPTGYETPEELNQQIARLGRSIDFLEAHHGESMTAELKEKTARMAHRVRFFNEYMRVMLLNHLRDQVRAGYSPYLHFRSASWPSDGPPVFGQVVWDLVLDGPWTWEGDVPIRLPGLLLKGDQVIHSSVLRPAEYEESWKRFDLDHYFRLLARRRGERRCPQCHALLPPGTHELRQYCSPECRANAKMQRYRDRQRQSDRPKHPWEELG